MNHPLRHSIAHERQEYRFPDFSPAPWAKNAHIQSVFASLRIRSVGENEMVRAARQMVVDCGDDIRLLGYHSPRPEAKALVLLIHGWEGSADSTYVLHSGRYLFRKGFDIFRLNLRDHGESHHLNEGIFHGALIDEVVRAVHRIAELARGKPFFIMGFSLGGNFALRIALSHAIRPVEGLAHIVCVSPLLDPYKSTICIDQGVFIYKYYFMKKWKNSLRKKERLFPHLYDFTGIMHLGSVLEMTDLLIKQYSGFSGYREYFDRYTLLGDTFADLTVPVTAIVAKDDPVIPVKDFFELRKNDFLNLSIQPHGGHCGFLDPFPCGCWYENHCAGLFQSYLNDTSRQ